MSARAGVLVTLEGGEGVGKSTLVEALRPWLAARWGEVVVTREPGGAPGADAIRGLLVRGDADRWTPITETLLHVAARSDHVARVIAPALGRGALVLCDRYADSTRAYQAGGHGVAAAHVEALHDIIAAPRPSVTLLLDAPVGVGLGRSGGAARAEDRYEKMGSAFHERVRAAFLAIAEVEPDRVAVLDATQPAATVAEVARTALSARLGLAP